MNGLVKEIQQWISPNRSKVYIIWSPLEEGFHIYYSSRRQLPTGLRLLIEFIQEARPLGL